MLNKNLFTSLHEKHNFNTKGGKTLLKNNDRTPNWQLCTDFIPVTDDFGNLSGFKRYKKHRFHNGTRVVFYDENKKFFLERRAILSFGDVKYKYSQHII